MVKKRKPKNRKWSDDVTKHSNALDLKKGVFTLHDPKKIAESLKDSAKHSHRRKGTPFQSAMSMLNFYINRAGKNLPDKQKETPKRQKGNCALCLDVSKKNKMQKKNFWFLFVYC